MKEVINIRISKELKEKLKKEAEENPMSLSSYLKSIISKRENKR